ncbi:hypothetical protein SK128_026422 [Halocaridina rubra]|uniref:Uncharacterized protein n=1 Tax=Halocaridina rubra TaxID=373956 RepID=A0AAN9A5B1_HALRR
MRRDNSTIHKLLFSLILLSTVVSYSEAFLKIIYAIRGLGQSTNEFLDRDRVEEALRNLTHMRLKSMFPSRERGKLCMDIALQGGRCEVA